MKRVNSEGFSSNGEAPVHEWVLSLREHGLAGAAVALIDALAPVAPMGAQALFIAQPAAGVFHARWASALGSLAHALETPGGREALRAALLAPESTDGR